MQLLGDMDSWIIPSAHASSQKQYKDDPEKSPICINSLHLQTTVVRQRLFSSCNYSADNGDLPCRGTPHFESSTVETAWRQDQQRDLLLRSL